MFTILWDIDRRKFDYEQDWALSNKVSRIVSGKTINFFSESVSSRHWLLSRKYLNVSTIPRLWSFTKIPYFSIRQKIGAYTASHHCVLFLWSLHLSGWYAFKISVVGSLWLICFRWNITVWFISLSVSSCRDSRDTIWQLLQEKQLSVSIISRLIRLKNFKVLGDIDRVLPNSFNFGFGRGEYSIFCSLQEVWGTFLLSCNEDSSKVSKLSGQDRFLS